MRFLKDIVDKKRKIKTGIKMPVFLPKPIYYKHTTNAL